MSKESNGVSDDPGGSVTGRRVTTPPRAAPDDDTLAGGLDTAHLRNVVQARLFGAAIDPMRIGRFPILRRIGRGGMGVVYAAYDNELDRKIALKLLHLREGGDEDAQRGRLLREAKALARLSHPGVVQVYEAGEHDGRVYLAMEFVRGTSLRAWLADGTRTHSQILDVLAQAGRGLAAAHAAGLVHRDVKPDNIVVGEDARVRVVDFGLAVDRDTPPPPAAPLGDDAEPIAAPLDRWTHTHGLAGTPAYMAPEQFGGEDADARSDQFAFAIVAFEALYGRRPFEGTTLPAHMAAVARGTVEFPRKPRVAKHVVAAIRRALSSERDERFPDLAGFVDALVRVPAKRIRWGFVLGTSAVIVSGILAYTASKGMDLMMQASMAAEEESREAELRATQAMLSESRATLATDPARALELLMQLPIDSPAWTSDAWSIAQGAADAGLSTSIVTMPSGTSAIRFAGPGAAVVNTGTGYARLDLETLESHEILRDLPLNAISADARWRVSTEGDALRLRDLDAGTERELHPGPCSSPRWAADAVHVAATCGDKDDAMTLLWHVDGRPPRSVRTQGRIEHVEAGRLLALADDGTWRLHELDGGRVHSIAGGGSLLAFDEPRARLVTGTASGIRIADMITGSAREVATAGEVTAVAFSPDGDALVLGGKSGEIWWLGTEGAVERSLETLGAGVKTIAWSPNARSIAVVSLRGTATVWDALGRRIRMNVADPESIRTARWLDDDTLETIAPSSIRRWRVAGARALHRDVAGLATCGDAFVVGHLDGRVVRHDANGSTDLTTGPEMLGFHASPDCAWMVAVEKNRLHVRAIDSDAPAVEILTRHFVPEIQFDAASRRLVWTDNCSLHTLQLGEDSPTPIDPDDGHCYETLTLRGDEVLVGDGPKNTPLEAIRRFALDGEREPMRPGMAMNLLVAIPGSDAIAVAGEAGVAVFEPSTGELRMLSEPGDLVIALAASPNGRRIAALPWQKPVRVWDLVTGSEYDTPLRERTDNGITTLRAWQLGPLVFTDDDSLVAVDMDRTASALDLHAPTRQSDLRDWVRTALPQRREAPVIAR
jgi:serine/threonine protein kinase/WD40 repeat protein